MTSPAADIPRAYNASDVEPRIYQSWMDQGLFTPEADESRTPFCVIMPPPNVTGELHLGHALTASIEDALTRWHRMMGDATLWLPGKDHAGIATQWVVERLLAEEGTNRHDLGREKFLERVWEWVARYGNTIDEQHKRLGASCDWSRLRFTLDPGTRQSRPHHLRQPVQQGPHLPARTHHQLVPPAAPPPCPTWRWSTRKPTAACTTSATRWSPAGDGGSPVFITVATNPPGVHARRYRRGSPPG